MRAFTSFSYSSIAKGALLTSILNTARCDRNELVKKHKTGQPIGTIYSHVVLGFGTAGTAAVDQLLKFGHPLDSILVVDPQIHLKTYNFNPKTEKRLTFHASSAANIDVAHKIVQLEDGSRVRYQNCLISVGSAPAPLQPPFVDADCDLKRTLVDLTHLNAPYDLYRIIASDRDDSSFVFNDHRNAKSIALVGANSFETVDLAGKLAIAAAQKHVGLTQTLQQQKKQMEKGSLPSTSVSSVPNKNAKIVSKDASISTNKVSPQAKVDVYTVPKDGVFMVYPAYGPMSHSLPRYLSLAVAKRLQILGVQLVPYSYVRYLGAADISMSTTKRTTTVTSNSYSTSNTSATTNTVNAPQVVLFLAKTYDSLNTTSLVADKVTFAPTSVPTQADRKAYHLDPSMYTFTNNAHCAAKVNASHPHRFLLRSGLELDNIAGGVVVNQSLQACHGVYVAGDVASVCNSASDVDLRDTVDSIAVGKTSTMRSRVLPQRGVVRGYQNALYSGTVSGRNMACNSTKHTANESTPLLYNHIPVYEAHSVDIGVHLTFIGNCTTALESHGYWWKLDNTTGSTTSTASATVEALRPPLGLGVVFYVDNSSVIHGVLVSGLPDTTSNDGTKSRYTERVNELCKQMVGKSVKSLTQYTNNGNKGNNSPTGASNAYKRLTLDNSFLTASENDIFPPDESDLHAQNKQNTPTIITTATASDAEAGSINTDDTIESVVNNGTDVYTSQVLSWEARRLLSPVLTPGLYKNTTVTTDENLNASIVNLPSTTTLTKAVQTYPRPQYRYCGPSHTTIKDLTEPHKDAIVRPMITREQLFQPEFANTGSKADNLQTAYKRNMAKDLF